jgi:hypothetical protein
MSNHPVPVSAALLGLVLLAGCGDDSSSPGPFGPGASLSAAPPASLVTISPGGSQLSIWPYTGNDFSGTPQDPINLVFTGKADPRAIRSALFALSGDRTRFGFPNVFPFNCTWSDAIGDLQTEYNEARRWVGSAVQLQCGIYQPVRFHVRLFNAGDVTLGNAHFEVLIPGTTDHQVLSWELAEQLVTVDLVRSGLLGGAPGSTGLINPAPAFREIPAVIYNGLPEDLKAAFGGPAGNVSAPVGIATNGAATVFDPAGEAAPASGIFTQDFVLQFGQVIPRPFCAEGPTDLVRVDGPVSLRKQVTLTPGGELVSEFHADGRLRLQRVDPTNGFAPVGPAYDAEVKDQQTTRYDESGGQVTGLQIQTEIPQSVDGRGRRVIRLKVGPGEINQFDVDVRC